MTDSGALPTWVAPAGRGELVVAVDTGSLDQALRLRDRLAGAVSFFKIGKELFTAAGPRAVSEFSAVGRVFLDLKYHDIPTTVSGAVRSAAALGASIVDVHASGGPRMLEAASRAARSASPSPLLLAVTVLTHLDAPGAAEVFGGRPVIADLVLRLARLASDAGLGGVVASADEIEPIREAFGRTSSSWFPGSGRCGLPRPTTSAGWPRPPRRRAAGPTIWWWAGPLQRARIPALRPSASGTRSGPDRAARDPLRSRRSLTSARVFR